MSFIFEIIGDILISLLRFVVEIPVIWIGEIILFLMTLGKHKPRWDVYIHDGGGDFVFLSEMSFWIGIVALCGIGIAIKLIFFSSI